MMDTNHLIAVSVLVQLAFTVARHFIHAPKQQAQLDSIERAVSGLIDTAGKGTTPQ